MGYKLSKKNNHLSIESNLKRTLKFMMEVDFDERDINSKRCSAACFKEHFGDLRFSDIKSDIKDKLTIRHMSTDSLEEEYLSLKVYLDSLSNQFTFISICIGALSFASTYLLTNFIDHISSKVLGDKMTEALVDTKNSILIILLIILYIGFSIYSSKKRNMDLGITYYKFKMDCIEDLLESKKVDNLVLSDIQDTKKEIK